MGIKLLVVGGGGGGASSIEGGGGGGGGFRYIPNYTVTETTYNVTVGSGGTSDNNGGTSVFGSISVTGGGKGGTRLNPGGSTTDGSGGGSGGGNTSPGSAGAYGYAGGSGTSGAGHGGGGGGAGGAGGPARVPVDGGGLNGAGAPCDITGTIVYYAAGGSGGYGSNYTSVGGGGRGSTGPTTTGHSATGIGSGGGGCYYNYDGGLGGTGGSGTVIVAYLTKVYNCSYTGSNVETFVSGDYTVIKFNASGSFTVNSYARWQTPISRWQLDGNANDLYGLNNGTENSTTYTTDSKQGSKAMSGGSVVLPTLIYRTSGYTFSAWFKNPGILNQFKNGSTFPRVNMVYTAGENRLYYYIHSAAGTVIFTDYLSYSDVNNWHHIVITDTGGTVRGYFDGAISTISGTYTPQELTTLNTCYISGGLDDVRFYDVALTADEVMNLYKSYATPIWQQPLHHWKLDGDATDSAGDKNGTTTDITYNSASKISGNYSGSFNGSSSNINVGDWSWASYTNFSVSAWFKVSGVSDAILTCTRPGYKFPRLQFMLGSAGIVGYAVVNDSDSVLLDTGAPKAYNDGKWHHTILIDANGTVTCYIDGFLSFSASYTRANLSNLTRVTMGALINTFIDRPLAGLLDDVRFYDVALSAADVRALYNSYFTEKATNFMSML